METHREKGVDTEDLAGHNVFLAVALGQYAAVAPRERARLGGGGIFVDFVPEQIKEFCLKIGQYNCNSKNFFCTFQIY